MSLLNKTKTNGTNGVILEVEAMVEAKEHTVCEHSALAF